MAMDARRRGVPVSHYSKEEAQGDDAPADEYLMVRIAAGDRAAFTALARRYMNILYAAAYRLCNDRSLAEEIVQETLVRLWTKADSWQEGRGASVRTWLYRIAYNQGIDMFRRRKIPAAELDENIASQDTRADDSLQRRQTGCIVAQAVASLPERQRMALVLCHYQELSNAEAAQIMGLTVKGVESLLVRARQSLHKRLKKDKGSLWPWI